MATGKCFAPQARPYRFGSKLTCARIIKSAMHAPNSRTRILIVVMALFLYTPRWVWHSTSDGIIEDVLPARARK